MAKLNIGREKLFIDLFMIPYISNIGIIIIIFGIGATAVAIFVDISLLLISLSALVLGLLLTFVPRYIFIDYSNGYIRKYYNWGIFTIGEKVQLDLFDRIEIVKQDLTYTRNSRFRTSSVRNITYSIFLGVVGTSEQFEVKEFLKHSEARAFAFEYADKLGLSIRDRAAESAQNREMTKKRRRR